MWYPAGGVYKFGLFEKNRDNGNKLNKFIELFLIPFIFEV